MAVNVTTLASLDGTDGSSPTGAPLIDAKGDLFAVASGGGSDGIGTVFEVSANTDQVTVLHSFVTADGDGNYPEANLSFDSVGNIYGTTSQSAGPMSGNAYTLVSGGTVFALSVFRGVYTYQKIADFAGSSDTTGQQTYNGVTVTADGTIYGATDGGGPNKTGTLFKIPPTGSTVTGTAFPTNGSTTNGPVMISAPTAVGTTLYGTAIGDETATNPGTIFSYDTTTSTVSTLATLNATTGYSPTAGVVADAAGDLFGTTEAGAAGGHGAIYEYVAATGTLQTLATFDGATTGNASYGTLLLDGAGNLFGTTSSGGASGDGTIFELHAGTSTIDVLHTFTGVGTDGAVPVGGLSADAAGNLYGTATEGGSNGKGTVFEVQGTDFEPACFASGTSIRTTRGDVPVEALRVGDLVVTAAGPHRPIRWLGHRRVDCDRHLGPVAVLPVRIAAHAFGPDRPARDLFVSPGHAICVDVVGETLIPAVALVDGATIVQVAVDSVTYWHVELDTHDVILAENLPAESYVDMGNRGFFAESNVITFAASPDAAQRAPAEFCRPLVNGGPIVEVVRARISARSTAATKVVPIRRDVA